MASSNAPSVQIDPEIVESRIPHPEPWREYEELAKGGLECVADRIDQWQRHEDAVD